MCKGGKFLDNVTKTGGFSSAGAKELKKMAEDAELYTKFLKFQGQVFKHKSSVALEFFAQKPDAQFIATREQWERLHYTLQAGASGLRFVDENGNQTELYDFSQIEEEKKPHVWTLNKQNAGIVKSELGIPDKESIITGTLRQMNIPEIVECMKTLQIPPQDFNTFRKSFMNAVHLVMAGRLETGNNSFQIPANPAAFQMLKTDAERLSFLTYVANTANRALMKIETTVQDITARKLAERNQQTQTKESKKPDTLGDLQELVRISVEISMQEKEFTRLFHQEEKQYEKISAISKEIADLKQEYQTLSQKIQQQGVTPEDIAMLRKIYPKRTSIQNLPEFEIARTTKFQKLIDSEFGQKSPYQMRQTDNAWRDENKTVPVITIAKRDVSNVRGDVKKGILERGNFVNQDTGITIHYGSTGINDSFSHAVRNHSPEARLAALYQMRDLIENAVQFDTQLSDNKKKSPNSLFMHKLYAVFQYENQYYLANLSVDESYTTDRDGKFSETAKKLYNAKSIKITPIGNLGFQSHGTKSEISDNGEPTSVTNLSIAQLYEIVKTYDKNFFENPKAPGREAREAEIYAHAQYLDAENAQNRQNHEFIPAETEKQVAKIAQAHHLSQQDTVSMLEKLVSIYSRFPADNKKSSDITANFDVEFAVKIQAAFEEVSQHRKLSPSQQEFLDALKDFAVTNHVSNDLVNKALSDCSRFRSQYTNKKWISQHIFYGRLTRTENELQEALKKYLPNAKADANTNFSDRHHAFENVIAKYELSETAQEILHLAEEQMRKNHYTSIVPVIFRMPDFQQYGSQQNIDEAVFGGKLKEIIAEINKNLQSEKVDTNINFSETKKSATEPPHEKTFAEQIDDVLNRTADRFNDLKVCDTPDILMQVGCQQLPMLYTQKHLKEAIKPKKDGNKHTHTHGLDIEQLKKIPELLREPVMILDSITRNDSIVVVTSEIDKDKMPIVVSIRPNGKGNYEFENIDSNFITSLYGRNQFENFLDRTIKSDNLLYWDKNKSQELFSVLELQSFKGLNSLDSNTIIHQSRNIVKPFGEKISEETEEIKHQEESITSEQEKVDTYSNFSEQEEFVEPEKSEIPDILEQNQKLIETIKVGDEITLHDDTFVVESITNDFMMRMNKKGAELATGSVESKQYIGNWKEDLLQDAGNELLFVRKSSEMQNELIPDTKSAKTYPVVSVKAGLNYDHYISPELEQKEYTIPEFNEALKKLSDRWDGEEYETKSAYVTLTIHLSETESYEKRLNAEYQFESLSQRLEYDIFDLEQELRKAVREAEKTTVIAPEEEKFQNENNKNISPINHNKTRSERLYEKFTELFPEIADGTHEYERYGNYNENGGIEPLSVEHLGGDTYAIMSYYMQNGDLMRDPDFTFNLKQEAKRLEILEYQQDGVPGIGTIYQRVHDEQGNPDTRLQTELEKNFEQILDVTKQMRQPLSEYHDKDGNSMILSDADTTESKISETVEETEEFSNDQTPHLRETLNEFSKKHGLGELNITSERYEWKLTETLQDGSTHTLGRINSPEMGFPFTPETLQQSLDNFEKTAEIRGQAIPELSNRQDAVVKHGGVSALPKVQKNLPEIVYATSPSRKISDNLEAIHEMMRLEAAEQNGEELYDKKSNQYNSKQNSENRLRRYCGWGGLPQLFDENFHQYDYYRRNLQSILTKEEYADARSSTLNAHYTPQIIIDAMYKAVQNMDLPRNARILEPSCGTGNFISRLPGSLGDAEITGVEIDSITARIATQLHRENPNVQIIQNGFERAGLENNSFDLAIGNVPFGDYNLNDPDYADNWRIHDAFFRKALDKVAPGGVVAFVTSCGTMDKTNPKVREYLAERAELIGAIRLPENAFSSAGTKTPTDMIFLKKRETPVQFSEKKPDWCYTVPDPNGSGLNINSYFVQNPQMVLGKIEKSSYQGRMTCVPIPDADLETQLNEAVKNLNAKITVAKREKAFAERQGKIEPWGKNFAFHIKNDKVYYRQGDTMREISCTDTERKQIAMLCEIRTTARALIDMQKTSVSDADLIPLREELNQKYDSYSKEFGLLSDKNVHKLFANDSDYPILISLENKESQKADIFSRRTVNATVEITSARTPEEALQISLDRKGKPDIPYMATLVSDNYAMPIEEVAEQVCKKLLEKGHIFIDPEKDIPDKPYSGVVERSEYLSGNVRMKLAFATEYAKSNPEYERNVQALEQVIPEDIRAEEISARMSCTWIDTQDYTEFLQHLSGRNSFDARCNVSFSPATGEFEIMNARSKKDLNQNETTTYGTSDYSMYELAHKILNQRRIVVKKEYPDPNDSSKTITRTDAQATKIALEKAKAIRQEFEKWIFATPERKEKYERRYNDIFNSLVGRNYDGSHLTFSGLANNFTLRQHQKNCVARAVYGGNTLAAHVVGAGKSAVMFTSVMKKKELGLINKACVVVPKALTEQTANEWRKLYPDAKILTVTNDDLSTEAKRNLFTARVATGSYDAVIMSQEQFEKIPMSSKYRVDFMRKEIDSLTDMLRDKKIETHGKRDYSVKAIERAKKQLEVKLDKLLNPKSATKAKDNLLEFEQLGFDYLVCDEAHAYKNGFVTTKMTNVAGVTTRPSGRAEDMQMKTDYFNETLGQGHILFCTGTPVSNSMTELYVMTRYLRPDLLEQAGVARFDDWAATFGSVVTKNQQGADGTLKLRTCFSKFANLPELMAMYKEFADVQSAEKLQLPRPALKTGKPQIVKVPASPEQKEYVRELAERAKLITEGRVDQSNDNLLKITGEARLIGLGNQAVAALYQKRGEDIPDGFLDVKDSKVDKCVENVARIYHEKAEQKGVQIIFSDVAVNSDNGNFSVYDYIKKELVAKGIPEDEIIFAPKSDAKNREAIFQDINNGNYRVVIASTRTLGTGANIQENLYALHHVDIPWKPSDFEQREGRILRQGNHFDEVEIFNYVTEGTLDSYLYQTVTDKARFIAQLLDDKCPARVSEDCDEKVLTFGEIQAAAEGNPDFRRRIELGNEIEEIRMLKKAYVHETATTNQRIQEIPDEIAEKQQILENIQQDKSSATTMRDFTLTTESGTVLREKKAINSHLLNMVQRMMNHPEQDSPKAKIGEFKLSVFVSALRDKIKFVLKGKHGYQCDAGIGDKQDNVLRLQNLLKSIPNREAETAHEIENLQLNLKQAEERVAMPFPREEELQTDMKELQELEERLAGLSEQTDSIYDEDDAIYDPEDEAQPVTETKEEKSAREAIYNADADDYQPTEEDNLKQFPRSNRM